MNYSKMKYIKLYEDYKVPKTRYGDLLQSFPIFIADLNYLCTILPLEYDIDGDIPPTLIRPFIISMSNIDCARIHASDIAIPTKNTALGLSAYDHFDDELIINYNVLVLTILRRMYFSDEQWYNILSEHPEFYQYLKDNKYYNQPMIDLIPKRILDGLSHLKNDLF